MDIIAPSLTHASKGNPSLCTIQKISDALGVSVASLFRVEEQKTVEGFAVIRGKKTIVFTNVEESGQIT